MLKSTIRANLATWLVCAAVLLMGLTPLWAEGPEGTGEAKNGPVSPGSGKGEGVVNVPSMPEPNAVETGEFGANGCRVTTTLTLGSSGVILQLPAEVPTAVASYYFNGVPVTTTLQEGQLHFDVGALESLRAEKIESIDIVLAASEAQYVRARVELPPGTDLVTVRIE